MELYIINTYAGSPWYFGTLWNNVLTTNFAIQGVQKHLYNCLQNFEAEQSRHTSIIYNNKVDPDQQQKQKHVFAKT